MMITIIIPYNDLIENNLIVLPHCNDAWEAELSQEEALFQVNEALQVTQIRMAAGWW